MAQDKKYSQAELNRILSNTEQGEKEYEIVSTFSNLLFIDFIVSLVEPTLSPSKRQNDLSRVESTSG